MVTVLAFSLQDQVEKYGAYVGLAAFLGLAVLSLLYFAQARELKRLRDWAGRAPERAAELEARVVAQADEVRGAPAPARARTVGPAQPIQRPPVAAPASANGRRPGAPVPVPMGPRPATAAAAVAASAGQVPAVPAVAWPGAEPAEAEPDETAVVAPTASAAAAPAGEAATVDRPEAPAESTTGDEPAAPGDESVPADESQAPADTSDAAAGEAPAPAEEAPADESQPQDAEAAPTGGSEPADESKARTGNGVPASPPRAGDIPPAPIPRATPRPAPAPRRAPAAPLRATSARTATVPPRRGTTQPPRRSEGSNAGRLALIAVLSVIVLGAGGFALTQLLGGEDDPALQPNRPTEPGGGPTATSGGSERAAEARPETVVVLLNGTPIEGLASQKREDLLAQGYSEEDGMLRTDNATDQQRQDSAVLFPSGQRRQARDVASILDIDEIELIDPDTQALADLTDQTGSNLTAEVVVVLGTDQAP